MLVRTGVQTYFVSYIMYTNITHACGHMGYIPFIHAYGFEIVLKILVFRTSHEKGDC